MVNKKSPSISALKLALAREQKKFKLKSKQLIKLRMVKRKY